MVKDNFKVVHIIKERGICPDMSLFLFAKFKMKGYDISHGEAQNAL